MRDFSGSIPTEEEGGAGKISHSLRVRPQYEMSKRKYLKQINETPWYCRSKLFRLIMLLKRLRFLFRLVKKR